MRTGSTLCSQTTEGIEPLGAFNQPAYRSYSQIRAALLNELGTPFADYFARPDFDADGNRIGWVAHELGEPRRWVDMPPEEQARLAPARQRLLEGFAKYRALLDAAPVNSPRNNFGKLLAQATYVPGPQYLYFVGEQPVAAFWGFKSLGMPAGIDPLRLVPGAITLGGADALAGEAVPLVVTRRRGWWWWLLWLLALLLLLALLFWGYAWWTRLPVPYGAWFGLRPAVTIETGRPALERQGVVLPQGGIVAGSGGVAVPGGDGTAGAGGVVVPPPGGESGTPPSGDVPPPGSGSNPAPTPPAPGPVTPPVDNHTPVPSDLPPLPRPGQPGQPAPHGPPLNLPQDAKPGPADFMQGVWRSRSGLMVNGSPTEEYYRFDKGGQGDVTLRTKDGRTQCTGPAHATVGAQGSLSVAEAPTLTCSDGSTVAGAVTTCSPGADHAACEGTNQGDGSRFGVQIEGTQKP